MPSKKVEMGKNSKKTRNTPAPDDSRASGRDVTDNSQFPSLESDASALVRNEMSNNPFSRANMTSLADNDMSIEHKNVLEKGDHFNSLHVNENSESKFTILNDKSQRH